MTKKMKTKTTTEKVEEGEPWKGSKAKELLQEDLVSGKIPLDATEMGPQVVYCQRTEFADIEYTKFRDRLRDLRKKIKQENAFASYDAAALARDRKIYPKAEHNHRGEPRWEGSEAERLLRLDMDEGKHKIMKPIKLYHSRSEYNENYPLTVFRKHIGQEEQLRKYIEYRRTRKK